MKKWFDKIFRPRYYAGSLAEDIFERQAVTAKWIMERISQDREAMKGYRDVAGRSVKRGDFICRNCRSAEIEVKCKTKYSWRGEDCYWLEYRHVVRHSEMKNRVTRAPVVFAFYERAGCAVLEDTLRMVDLDFLLGTRDYRGGKLYNSRRRCIAVPFRYTRPGFEVLEILTKSRAVARRYQ